MIPKIKKNILKNYKILAKPAKGNATLESVADKYAEYLADYNLFQHSQTAGLGENLAYIWSSRNPNLQNCTSKINLNKS